MTDPYFDQLNDSLRIMGLGRPVMLLDLDRVDHNLDLIAETLGDQFRLVTKSLPSTRLIDYALERTASQRLMAFHIPYVRLLLDAFPRVDVLMGKPLLGVAVKEFFAGLDTDARRDAADRVQWLCDTPARLEELVRIASSLGLRLRLNVEIDVGLHRGGVRAGPTLDELLGGIAATDSCRFSGFMGYDAHVPFMPAPDEAFARAMERYRLCIDQLQSDYLSLAGVEQLTFNSGGSKTYFRFSDETVNDVAAGSAVVRPSTFDVLEQHQPALFIATPVFRKFPRFSKEPPARETAMSLYLYGGGWAADVAHPPDIAIGAGADPGNQNLLPNQCLYETHMDTSLDIGDFVFLQPQQGDALFQFEETLVVRGGEVVDRFTPLPRRY